MPNSMKKAMWQRLLKNSKGRKIELLLNYIIF